MRRLPRLLPSICLIIGLAATAACARSQDPWRSEFEVDARDLGPTGRNPYFILEPGYTLVLEGGDIELTITVLDQTQIIDGVETRVVEERETRGGQLDEISRNFFAISRQTNDVFYFGEEVDMYKDGRITSHEGAWISGVDDARFGLMMPGRVELNAKFYNEIAPGVALDRVTVLSTSYTVETPAGTFTDCVQIRETTPLHPTVIDHKYYAPGVGIVQDGSLKLVRFGSSP